jgi:hypothetical protein
MKSPAEAKAVLKTQWQNPTLRELRLLGGPSQWPIRLPIGRPLPRTINRSLDEVKRHVESWREVRAGQVLWEQVAYRSTAAPVDIPATWLLARPSDWVEAADDPSMRREFRSLATLVERTASDFHSLLIRRRSLWSKTPLHEVIQAATLALSLTPGCAQGQSLRQLSLAGIDTKFFERNTQLVKALLDVRFDGEASRIGLEDFLGALRDGDHWLLVVDLDGSLLPFQKLRVRSSDLKGAPLPGDHLLIIENESCQHHLPHAPGTIAVLGSGFDLNWTEGTWLASKQVAYWGDLDTWGLQFLATARNAIPHLVPLFMNEATFDEFTDLAVREPVAAASDPPTGLSDSESRLYRRLLGQPRGRLEQEFVPADRVREAILDWLGTLR